ncbi:MAG: VOC family protein [Deltaproteobacteria bacterium]|nr:MAG: VOC family protein [Deltaproteobacteria bacterium]
MSVLRMSHLGICVADRDRSLRFYRDGLGFREVSRLRARGAATATLLQVADAEVEATFLERDGVRIELLAYAKPGHCGPSQPGPMNRLGLTHLSLRVDDLDGTLAALRATDARVLDETRIEIAAADTRAVFVTDPDGTRIELVQAPGDPAAPPGAG